MPDVIVIPSATVERLRRKAKKLKKDTGVSHHDALDLVARDMRFPDWHHVIEAAKATEPSEQAFKAGLVIGVDRKEIDGVNLSRLTHFTLDEQAIIFLLTEYEKRHPKPWTEDDEFGALDFEGLAYFRPKGVVPGTLEETLKVCQEDFFWPPWYVRLRGKVVLNMFQEGEGDDA